MGGDRRFVRESAAAEEVRRQAFFKDVSDVREVMFTLIERAQLVSGSEAALVDALQGCIHVLGEVEASLQESQAGPQGRATTGRWPWEDVGASEHDL